MLADVEDLNMMHESELIEAKCVVTPKFALVAHAISSSGLFTFHEFKNGEMTAGRPISPERAVEALRAVCPATNGGWVAERLLYTDASKIVWYCPSHKRNYWLRNVGDKGKSEMLVTYPTLIFIADRVKRNLAVFAVDGNERPTQESQLYHAPVMNVYASGLICLGGAKLPDNLAGSDEDMLNACENCLLDSYYTHVNHKNTFKSDTPDSVDNIKHLNMWQKLSKENRAPTADELVKTPHTLGSVVQSNFTVNGW